MSREIVPWRFDDFKIISNIPNTLNAIIQIEVLHVNNILKLAVKFQRNINKFPVDEL